jgi:hypothetical protein
MDRYNANRTTLEHIAHVRRFPDDAVAQQVLFNRQRLIRAYKARSISPIIIPLNYRLDAGGRTAPYSAQTPEFPDPIEILALVHNFEVTVSNGMNVSINRESARFLGLAGSENFIQPDTLDMAGHRSQGPHVLPVPIVVNPGDRLTVDVYKKVGDAGATVSRWVSLIGQRVLPNSDPRAAISPAQLESAQIAIAARSVPQFRVIEIDLNDFQPDGAPPPVSVAAAQLPDRDEPLLIHAFRSQSMMFSLVRVRRGYEGDLWTTEFAPVWSLANCYVTTGATMVDTNWQFLPAPYLIFPNEILSVSAINQGAEDDQYDPNHAGTPRRLSVLAETL